MISKEHLNNAGEWKQCYSNVKRCKYKTRLVLVSGSQNAIPIYLPINQSNTQITKRQHYIPTMHMALFGNPAQKPARTRDTKVAFLRKDETIVKNLGERKVEKVAVNNYLYEKYSLYTNDLENFFSDLENKVAPLITRLANQKLTNTGFKLKDHTEYTLLYKYTELLYLRNASNLDLLDEGISLLQKQVEKKGITAEQFWNTTQNVHKDYGQFIKANLTVNLAPKQIFIGEVEEFLPLNLNNPLIRLTSGENPPTFLPISTKRFLLINNHLDVKSNQRDVGRIFEANNTEIKIEDFYIKALRQEKEEWIVDSQFSSKLKQKIENPILANYDMHFNHFGKNQLAYGFVKNLH